jgi:dipeptidyl-peptidase-4
VPLAGGAPARLTEERGVHAVAVDPTGSTIVDVHSARERLPKAVVKTTERALLGELPVVADKDLEGLALRPVELVDAKADDGTVLHGALLKPRNMQPGVRYPAVVVVYGGPGAQFVTESWGPRLLWQHLADRGFVVFQLDNRGSIGRGHAFAAPIYKRMGEIELADQLVGLSWLTSQPFVDASRVGIYGHSYGGFMAAYAMFKAPGKFKAGVAGSPVTDWRLYDTGYTERFMSTPADNEAGYAASDLAPLATHLDGKLFVIHALMDENVHFANTAHLVDALVAAHKTFDLFVFPGERHGYRDPAARAYAMRRVVDYFVDNL